MEERKFETYAKESRKNLETILFGKEPFYKKINNSLLNLRNQAEKFDKDSNEQTHFRWSIQVGSRSIKLPSFISLRILRLLPRISATARYVFFHEIGELSYIEPLWNYMLLKNPDEGINICMSEITASDVFGDLLASTFSPLSPKKQLELLETKNLDDFINLRLKEYMFIEAQLSTIKAYETRKEEGYIYGPELKDFYKEMLNLQLGFNDTERKNFQLKLYDTAQRQIGNRLRNYDKITEDNIAAIFFNADSLISELKSSPLF